MSQIVRTLPADAPPWAINIMVHRSYARWEEELELVLKHKPPIVITALGSPVAVVEAIHSYGGLVYADVNSLTYAQKAASAGVDGLVLVAAGQAATPARSRGSPSRPPCARSSAARSCWAGASDLDGPSAPPRCSALTSPILARG